MPELAVQQKIGPYLLLREAGQGGLAIVFEAQDERTGQTVAVKLLKSPLLTPRHREERLAHLDREAATLADLSHPNVVTLRQERRSEAGPSEDLHYIVLEYLDGTNLRTRMGHGQLSRDTILFVLEQVAEGLDAVHAAGLAYGDLKPSNIVLLRDGDVKLIDFGLARPKRAWTGARTGPLTGSPAYLAPELIRGGPVSPAADLWAMGILLYEMLTGGLPFAGSTVADMLSGITHGPPAPLPPALATLDPVLRRALDKNPRKRFPSAQALVTAYAAAAGLRCRWTDAMPTPARPQTARRWAAAGMGAALGAGLAVAALRHFVAPMTTPAVVALSPPIRVRVADSRQERHVPPAPHLTRRGKKSPQVTARPVTHRPVTVAEPPPPVRHLPVSPPVTEAIAPPMPKAAKPFRVVRAVTVRPAPSLLPPPTVQAVPRRRVSIAPAYTLTALGPLGDDVQSLNDRGQSVGGLGGFAVLWDGGTLRRLDGPTGATDISPYSEAAAINDRGQVAGFSHFHAFLWQDGRMTDLGTLAGRQSNATALNDAGQVVGTSHDHAVWWHDGQITDLGTLGGDESHARAINDRGQIAGVSYTPDGYYHAFLWQDGQMTDLGTLGGRSSLAVAVNDRGQVAGLSVTATGATHAFVWQDGRMADLGTLGAGGDSQALGLGPDGAVVGSSGNRAALWRGGEVTDLNTQLGPDAGVTLRRAVAVNAHGQVLCYGQRPGGATQAFLLTPTATAHGANI